jgi:hypothetical protein
MIDPLAQRLALDAGEGGRLRKMEGLEMASQQWHWEQGTKYAAEGIKTTLVLNGAAAIALMTFATTNTQKVSLLLCPLISFVIGAGLSAFAFLAAYLVQLYFGNAEGTPLDRFEYLRLWKVGRRWSHVAIGSVVLSVVAFGVGICLAASVLPQLAATRVAT